MLLWNMNVTERVVSGDVVLVYSWDSWGLRSDQDFAGEPFFASELSSKWQVAFYFQVWVLSIFGSFCRPTAIRDHSLDFLQDIPFNAWSEA